jgi:hypothetical protein
VKQLVVGVLMPHQSAEKNQGGSMSLYSNDTTVDAVRKITPRTASPLRDAGSPLVRATRCCTSASTSRIISRRRLRQPPNPRFREMTL